MAVAVVNFASILVYCYSANKVLCRILTSFVFVFAVEHLFEVIVESVSGLKLLDSMIWGEADCFVQYYFPAQMASAGHGGGATVVCGTLSLLLS